MPGPGWIVTPGTMLDYLREVDRFIDAIHAQVAGQIDKMPPPTAAAWVRFYTDWKVFFLGHQDFSDRLSGSVADTAERYEKDAALWRARLAGFVDVSGVVFDDAKRPGGPSLEGTTSTLQSAAWLVGGGVLLWLMVRK